MLKAFSSAKGGVELEVASIEQVPDDVRWIDLLCPSVEEESSVERLLGIAVPTREDMIEIEPSSRLYRENGSLHLTASILAGVHAGEPRTVPVTFVLTADQLVTVRYDDPKSFQAFAAHVERQPELCRSPASTLVSLLEAVVERTADVMEEVDRRRDRVSNAVFHRRRLPNRRRMTNVELEDILFEIGGAQETLSKVRESLASLARLISYLAFQLPSYEKGEVAHLKTVARDVASLTDQAAFMSSNITFLLDAALGLINIEQNAIIKIFSVAAVIFLPPTLVGTIYGMNFDYMPELNWVFGYPFALVVMIASAVLPYLWFRSKGWL